MAEPSYVCAYVCVHIMCACVCVHIMRVCAYNVCVCVLICWSRMNNNFIKIAAMNIHQH